MSQQAKAKRICKQVLDPFFEQKGFDGRFPSWHRLGRLCVECVTVTVYVRGGVRVAVGALPPRRFGQRTPAQDVQLTMSSSGKDGVFRRDLRLYLPIDTPKEMKALQQLDQLLNDTLQKEAVSFWRAYDDLLKEQVARQTIQKALDSGNPRTIRAALQKLSPRRAQRALDNFTLHRWTESSTVLRVFKIAPELMHWRPPWKLGSAAAAGAALVLTGRATKAERRRAQAVIDWVHPHIKRVKHLGGQMAVHAEHLALEKKVPAAAYLFDLVINRINLRRPELGNALWTVMASNNPGPAHPARARRFIRAAIRQAPDDPSVRFNSSCISMELNDRKAAIEHLVEALRHGSPPDHLRSEPRLSELLCEPRIVAALRKPGQRPKQTGFRSHHPPKLH